MDTLDTHDNKFLLYLHLSKISRWAFSAFNIDLPSIHILRRVVHRHVDIFSLLHVQYFQLIPFSCSEFTPIA